MEPRKKTMDTQTDQVIEARAHDIVKVIVSLFNQQSNNAFIGLFTTRVMSGCHWFFAISK